MAISSDKNRVSYSGDGSSATFNFQYEFHGDSELGVFVHNSSRTEVIASKVLNSDYTINGVSDTQNRYLNGANVIFNSSPAVGDEIVIFRSSAVNSTFTLPYSGTIPSAELVKALDRLTMIAQRLNDQTTRSVRVNDAYPFSFDSQLPALLPKGAPLIVSSSGVSIDVGLVAAGSSFLGILNAVNGGTGKSLTPSIGDMLYADSGSTFDILEAGTGGMILQSRGADKPVWEKINLGSSTQVIGALGFEQGGTGYTTIGAEGLVLIAGTGALNYQKINVGSSETITGTLAVTNGGTGLGSFNANELLYSSNSTTISNLGGAAAGRVLTSNGSSAPTFETVSVSPLTPVTTTADYVTTASEDLVIADSSLYTITVMDATANTGREITIKRISDTLGNAITINGSGAQTIDGDLTKQLHTQYEAYRLQSDGSNWQVLHHTYPSKSTRYTPSTNGLGTITNVQMTWRRVGDSVEIQGKLTAGVTTASEGRIGLPSGLTSANSSIIQDVRICGIQVSNDVDGGSNISTFFTTIEPSVTYTTFSYRNPSTSPLDTINGNAAYPASSVIVLGPAFIPIEGWEG